MTPTYLSLGMMGLGDHVCPTGQIWTDRIGACIDNVGVAANGMPLLPPNSCSPSQTFIPPGSVFPYGSLAGQISQTGACLDSQVVSLFNQITLGGLAIPDILLYGGIALVVILLMSGRK